MEPIKRKRVTRVGSGAYSIYLPKKWIDGWSDDQRALREVDLHQVNESLLIVPAIQALRHEAVVSDAPEQMEAHLLSAYVRGFNIVALTPASGQFHTESQLKARDVLRHTDERIVVHVSPDMIGFELEPGLAPPFHRAEDLMALLASRVREVLELGTDAMRSYGDDPERAVHAMQMLQSIHEDDVDRLWHQALRLVATIALPLETVSDFQVLDLCAAELHTASSQMLRLAAAIMEEWDCSLETLAYPRTHIMAQVPALPALPPIARGMLRAYGGALDEAIRIMPEALQALQTADIAQMQATAMRAREAQNKLQDALFANAVKHWGEPDADNGARSSTTNRISHPVGNILGSLARLSERGVLLLAAKPEANP